MAKTVRNHFSHGFTRILTEGRCVGHGAPHRSVFHLCSSVAQTKVTDG
jgi:hypothetical protein